ncbi:MAG: sodium:calcium antiporter, partial [Halobacteria archaeon]|nr:sodium:calcium antiporter [Halobacteria archaeon]
GMVLAMIIMIRTIEDGVLQRSEAFLMMLSYVFFVYHLYTNEGGEEITEEIIEEEMEKNRTPKEMVPRIVVGIVLVVVGGHFMVTNGTEL